MKTQNILLVGIISLISTSAFAVGSPSAKQIAEAKKILFNERGPQEASQDIGYYYLGEKDGTACQVVLESGYRNTVSTIQVFVYLDGEYGDTQYFTTHASFHKSVALESNEKKLVLDYMRKESKDRDTLTVELNKTVIESIKIERHLEEGFLTRTCGNLKYSFNSQEVKMPDKAEAAAVKKIYNTQVKSKKINSKLYFDRCLGNTANADEVKCYFSTEPEIEIRHVEATYKLDRNTKTLTRLSVKKAP